MVDTVLGWHVGVQDSQYSPKLGNHSSEHRSIRAIKKVGRSDNLTDMYPSIIQDRHTCNNTLENNNFNPSTC